MKRKIENRLSNKNFRLRNIEERVSDVEDMIGKMASLLKKMLKLKSNPDMKHSGNTQEIRDSIKTTTSVNERHRERRRSLSQKRRKYFYQNHRRKFPQFKKEGAIKLQEAYRIPNRWAWGKNIHDTW